MTECSRGRRRRQKLEADVHCGASSKDAGNKITTIMQIENTEIYHILMDKLKR